MTLVRKRLHQLGRVVTGKTPPTARQELFQGEYLFVTPSDLDYNHYYCRSAERTVSEQAKATLRNQFIPANAVMFTCIGATIGKCGIAPSECLTNQQINSVIANDECDPRFLYYLLCNSVDIVKGMGGGAATPIVNKSKFENIDFLVPPLRQQQEVGRILSAYDDMIENNRRRIVLLEEAARLLYREWFVHFRFPGHEHVPLTDGLPAGWERRTLAELADDVSYGFTASASHEIDGPKFLRITDIVGGPIDWSSVPRCPISPEKQERFLLAPEDIVVARTGATTGWARRVGRQREPAVFASYLVRFRFSEAIHPAIAAVFMQSDQYKAFIKGNLGGAAQPNAGAKVLGSAAMPVAPPSLQRSFAEAAIPLLDQIDLLSEQNEKLAQARDLLLPRLMNGEIAV